MLLHRKVIAFTKKRVRKVIFSRPLAGFYVLFSPGLHFLVNKIQRAKSLKCPILCSPGGIFYYTYNYYTYNKNCCKFTDLLLILQICNSLSIKIRK